MQASAASSSPRALEAVPKVEVSEHVSDAAGMDREEPEKPAVKKLRNAVKGISDRVDAVEKTCAEVKSTTDAELARLRDHVAKIEADQTSHNATVDHRLEHLWNRYGCIRTWKKLKKGLSE